MMQADGKATSNASTFRLEYAVAINVRAPTDRIWTLLTNAADIPRWNSTVKSLEGDIALGNKVKLGVPVSDQTFTLKIAEFEPSKRLVLSHGMAPMFTGVRTFTLTSNSDGSTDFSMAEVFKGLMLPVIKRKLPDFVPQFEQYAKDLRAESESDS